MRELPFLKDFGSIAIIQTAFIGDVALSFYLAQSVKNYDPKIKIFFVATPVGASLADRIAAIDETIVFDKRGADKGLKGIKAVAAKIEEKGIECVISLHRSARTAILTKLAKAKYSVSFDKSSLSFLYSKRVPYLIAESERERNFRTLSAFRDFAKTRLAEKVEINFRDSDVERVEKLLKEFGIGPNDKLIAVAPGSVWATKRWEKEYFAETAKKLSEKGYVPVVIGSGDDREVCESVAKERGWANLAGKTSLPESTFLISKCSLTITNDSAPTHFSNLVETPVLTIFCATSPKFGFAPFREFDSSVELEGLKCKPCGIHGGAKCPRGDFRCSKDLKPAVVLSEAEKILRRAVER